jgi:hypothetical protein
VDTVAAPAPAVDTTKTYKMLVATVPFRWTTTRRMDSLTNAGFSPQLDSVGTGKSMRYRIYLNASHPANDTIALKDSLSKVFRRPVKIIP